MNHTISQWSPNNRVAGHYVERALKRLLVNSFQAYSSSPCVSCRRSAHKTFLDRRRRLQKMEQVKRSRAKSAPPRIEADARSSRPSRSSAQPSQKPLETGKKRKTSASEPREVGPQPKVKKPRGQQEASQKPEKKGKASASEPLGARPQSRSQQGSAIPTGEPQSQKSTTKGSDEASASNVQKPAVKGAKDASASSVQKKAPDSVSVKKTPSNPSSAAGRVVSKLWPKSMGQQKTQGLENPANWCYRRSVLQSLIAIPQLFNLIESSHTQCSNQARCVTCSLRHLIRTYHTSNSREVDRALRALDDAIKLTGKSSDPRWRFTGHTQEDGHEFLEYLLGTIGNAKGIPRELSASVFRIKHRISWTCFNCRKEHIRSDPSGLGLPLSIPSSGRGNISTCMDAHHIERNLTITCDRCNKTANRTRVLRIEQAPQILCVQFKRFVPSSNGYTKNKLHVDYPEELDLSPWCLNDSKPMVYRLKAVVVHSGTLYGGHYKAYVSSPDGVKEINDADCYDSNVRELKRASGNFTPYILVYIRQ